MFIYCGLVQYYFCIKILKKRLILVRFAHFISGAGFPVNWQRAYPLISDILNFVKQSARLSEDPTFKRLLFR